MEPITFVVDKFKGFGTASHNFIDGLLHGREKSSGRSPIEILKRLQREVFSDLTKLRNRQDKVEKVLSFYNTQRGKPFQENVTHVQGEVDISMLMIGVIDNNSWDLLHGAGRIHSKLTFETRVRDSDSLVAEFVTNQKAMVDFDTNSGNGVTLSKVLYKANVKDWLSAIVVPTGARCRDVAANPSHQEKGLTDISSFGPPLLDQPNGAAIGLSVRKSNVTASLAQFISTEKIQPSVDRIQHSLGTLGQLVWQFQRGTKLSLLGLLQVPKLCSQPVRARTFPGRLRSELEFPETVEAPYLRLLTVSEEAISMGSIAFQLESELDEVTKLGGWIEVSKSNPNSVQWAVSMSDDNKNEDAFGWGMKVSGIYGDLDRDKIQIESYVKLNMDKGFNLKPGIVYTTDCNAHMMGFLVRSSWSF